MGSDRARNTFDRVKQYRRVIAQQGRVELEADKNESSEIATEALRLETIDIVGPYGVPSDPVTDDKGTGYQIAAADVVIPLALSARSAASARSVLTAAQLNRPDFKILPGTIYLGGWRVEQEVSDLTFFGQANGDWLPTPAEEQTDLGDGSVESIVLHLTEHEVSAVEDRSLREVALGGPDTAQRMRLTRRVRRFPVKDRSCRGAFNDVIKVMDDRGFHFDPDTMALESTATLLVTPDATPPQTNPCDPVARGGYLGADNQMICVQLTAPGASSGETSGANTSSADTPRFLWAYDDASDLYAVTADPSDLRKLTLSTMPVDAFHWPKSQQFVEVLAASVKLADDGYEAADSGTVFRLAADFDPDTGIVRLDNDLDAAAIDSPALFLRVWQNAQAFTPGTPVELVDRNGTQIGLQITIDGTIKDWRWHEGEFWNFAVRPGFPEDVFPARYAKTPQAPEGPRQWMAPLAFITWAEDKPTITDCRPDFDDLVQLTKEIDELDASGCCTIRIEPKDATKLQEIVDRYKGRNGATICLSPGVYRLGKPLRLTQEHSAITIEGAEAKVTLRADDGAADQFPQGLVEITEASGIRLRNIAFDISDAPIAKMAGLDRKMLELVRDSKLSVGFGLRPVNSEVAVENCSFEFLSKNDGDIIGAAIFAGGETTLEVRDCTFTGTNGSIAGKAAFIGILVTPSVEAKLQESKHVQDGTVLAARLVRLAIDNNEFAELRAAALMVGQFDRVHIEENDVRDSYAGFLLTVPAAWGGSKDFSALKGAPIVSAAMMEALDADRWLRLAVTLGSIYPLPTGTSTAKIYRLSQLDPGKTYESSAASAAASFRNKIFEKAVITGEAGATTVKAAPAAKGEPAVKAEPAAAPAAKAEPTIPATKAESPEKPGAAEAVEFLTARNPPPLPIELHAATEAVNTVLWNIAALRPTFTTLQVRGGSIQIENNDIDLGTSGIASLFALAVIDPSSTVVVSANHATNMYLFLPTVLLLAKRTAVTGNAMINYATRSVSKKEQASFLDYGQQMQRDLKLASKIEISILLQRYSLWVVPHGNDGFADAVITGNLCEGRMLVPTRPSTAGPTWQQLNTEVP